VSLPGRSRPAALVLTANWLARPYKADLATGPVRSPVVSSDPGVLFTNYLLLIKPLVRRYLTVS
jgi:hypothetical protein